MAEGKPRFLEFANFTLNFGKGKVLADLWKEVAQPAFLDESLERKYGDTTYFFLQAQELNLGSKKEMVPAIAGRFVKDFVLRREQTFDPDKRTIKRNAGELKSAPTAIFVLLLLNHKLLYLHETSQAPGLDAFRSTVHAFLKKKYFQFIERVYSERNKIASEKGTPKVTKKSLKEEFLPPELTVVPLPSEESVGDAIERFTIIERMKVELLPVNAEANVSPFFEQMRQMKNASGASKSIFIEQDENGLNSEAVVSHVALASAEGNALVTLKGKKDGAGLVIGNKEMRLQYPLAQVPDEMEDKAKLMNQTFVRLANDETIIVGTVAEEEVERLRKIFGGSDG